MLAKSLADANMTWEVVFGTLIFIFVLPMLLDIFLGDRS